jgi:putative radical SAM enzyme (TIGR03279 family)
LGLDFDSPTFDGMRRCHNQCEVCFVAQMPPGLRRSLYVRDDDYRYSLLYGSFITLTNLTAQDWERLAEQRLSPLYISVHATEPALRQRLLGRKDIPDILPQIDRLGALGIEIHTQVVLTPGLNDGAHLERTVAELGERYPTVQSIGVVPVGLTRYHRGRCRLYTPGEARAMVRQIAPLQREYRARHGLGLVYLADEWYLLAKLGVPGDELYDGYPQIENGIGLVRQFLDESRSLSTGRTALSVSSCTLICGTLVAPVLRCAARRLAVPGGVRLDVVPAINRLFGETVTVSGLLGGEDVLAALRGRDLGEMVFLPRAMFSAAADREDEVRTLDDLRLQDLGEHLRRPVVMAETMGEVWAQLVARPKGKGK